MRVKAREIVSNKSDALCHHRGSRLPIMLSYMCQCGFYLYSIAALLTWETRRKDLSHHVITMLLIGSYLTRTGHFDAEVEATTPPELERLQIFKLYSGKLPLDPSVDLRAIAANKNGYVGADLESLCRKALIFEVGRSSDITKDGGICSFTMDDWNHARSVVGPRITGIVTVEVAHAAQTSFFYLRCTSIICRLITYVFCAHMLQEHVEIKDEIWTETTATTTSLLVSKEITSATTSVFVLPYRKVTISLVMQTQKSSYLGVPQWSLRLLVASPVWLMFHHWRGTRGS